MIFFISLMPSTPWQNPRAANGKYLCIFFVDKHLGIRRLLLCTRENPILSRFDRPKPAFRAFQGHVFRGSKTQYVGVWCGSVQKLFRLLRNRGMRNVTLREKRKVGVRFRSLLEDIDLNTGFGEHLFRHRIGVVFGNDDVHDAAVDEHLRAERARKRCRIHRCTYDAHAVAGCL